MSSGRRLRKARDRALRADQHAEMILAAWDADAATSAEVEIAEARAAGAWVDYRCLARAMSHELRRASERASA